MSPACCMRSAMIDRPPCDRLPPRPTSRKSNRRCGQRSGISALLCSRPSSQLRAGGSVWSEVTLDHPPSAETQHGCSRQSRERQPYTGFTDRRRHTEIRECRLFRDHSDRSATEISPHSVRIRASRRLRFKLVRSAAVYRPRRFRPRRLPLRANPGADDSSGSG